MAFNYTTGAGVADSGVLPVEYVRNMFAEAEKTSVVLKRAKRQTINTSALSFPILSLDGQAKFLNGPIDQKPVAEVSGGLARMNVEELALIVPIADAIVADGGPELDREILAKIKEEFARVIDLAVLFGSGKPTSFPVGLVPGAIAAGNVVADGDDPIKTIIDANSALIADGFRPTGYVGSPATAYSLQTARDTNGQFLFGTPTAGVALQPHVFGIPLDEAAGWDEAAAKTLSVDWGKVVVGIREDVTYSISNEAPLYNPDGTLKYALWQQDMTAIRVVMRLGVAYAVDPAKLGEKFPAAVVTPAAA